MDLVLERSLIGGSYLHVCFSNQGRQTKTIGWHVFPDAEAFENTIKDREKVPPSGSDKFYHEFSELIARLEDFKSQMQAEEFGISSITDLSGIQRKVKHSLFLSLVMIPIIFLVMYLAVKYIVNNSEKKD